MSTKMQVEICLDVTAFFYPEHLTPPDGVPLTPEIIKKKFDEIVKEHYPAKAGIDYGFKKETWVGNDSQVLLFVCSEGLTADDLFAMSLRTADEFFPGLDDEDVYFQSSEVSATEVVRVFRNQ